MPNEGVSGPLRSCTFLPGLVTGHRSSTRYKRIVLVSEINACIRSVYTNFCDRTRCRYT
jgi:hypothetical protein